MNHINATNFSHLIIFFWSKLPIVTFVFVIVLLCRHFFGITLQTTLWYHSVDASVLVNQADVTVQVVWNSPLHLYFT